MMTDEQIDAIAASMPDGEGGMLRKWGYRQFARAVADHVAEQEWPTLSDLHLQALMFAYNEGYSKAIDGRKFKNPFSSEGSQAAAWELGTADGAEARRKMASAPVADERRALFALKHIGTWAGVGAGMKTHKEVREYAKHNAQACTDAADMGNPVSIPPVVDERTAVAYLDLGAGGYMDMDTDLTEEQLAALPKGRHMLAIIGTHGVNGYTPASAPVADESPMAKMADVLREKARKEQQAYQDRRNQATEWGPMPEGTEADHPIPNAPVAHVAGNEASRYLEWAKDRSAWEMPVGTPVYYSAMASAPVAGEAQQRVAYTDSMGHLHWTNGRRILVSLYAAPQASEAVDRSPNLQGSSVDRSAELQGSASEAVRDAALNDAISILLNLSARYRYNYDKEGCNSYHEGGVDALDEAEQSIRAALSAQPEDK